MIWRLCLLLLAVLSLSVWPQFYLLLGFSALLAVVVLWDGVQQQHLRRWAKHPKKTAFPDASGRWGSVLAAIQKAFRQQQHDMRQLADELYRVKSVLSALPESVVFLDVEDRIVWANQTAEKLLQIKTPTDVGTPIAWQVRDPGFIAWLGRRDAARYKQEISVGSNFKTLEHLRSLAVEGQTGASVLLTRDISEAVKLDQMRRDFVANVSHELRTPLTVVCANVETLQNLTLNKSEQDLLLATTARQGTVMTRILEDLLMLSRVDSGQVQDEEWVGLSEFLTDMRLAAEALSQGRHELLVEDTGRIALFVNRNDLYMMVNNLVNNAVHYTEAGTRIVMGAVRHKDACIVYVNDNGAGIAPEHLPRLTERFYRVDKARTRLRQDAAGTGLGLAIVKNSAQRYQASLEIKSTLGKGAEFRLVFPLERVKTLPAVIKP
ncbi:MAG: phosphate regulon sensor histidine kinase PhoR [Pseudomonadota bacterium]